MPILETTDLTKQYDGTTAIDDVSLTVTDGDVYGLLGPNGAGKSTLINSLLDFIKPTSGTATICGDDAQTETVAVHNNVGVLPDGFQVFPRLSGRRHLQYVADARNTDIDPDAYLGRVGLADSADQTATEYSRGMQQRLGIAMALVDEPPVIIFDEPFAGLDPDGVRRLRTIITTETDRGATVMLSSHRLDQVERICTRVGLLADGALLAEGTPEELLAARNDPEQFVLRTSGPPDHVVTTVADLPVTREVTVDGATLRVTCSTGTDPEEVRLLLEDTAVTVDDIQPVEPSLEDIYAMYAGERV